MNKISLRGSFRLYKTMDDFAHFSESRATMYEVTVPCNVEDALMAAGELPNILKDNAVQKTREIEFFNWLFEKEFTLSKEDLPRLYLLLDGADTFAEYYLNGEKIGESRNALISHEFCIEKYAKEGKNLLQIFLTSTLARSFEYEGAVNCCTAFEGNYENLSIRKSAVTFGWDIQPRCLSAGITRDIYLEQRKDVYIQDVYLSTTYVTDNQAGLQFSYFLKFPPKDYGKYRLRLSLTCKDSRYEYEYPVSYTFATKYPLLKNPYLWWVHTVGEPNLYDVEVGLYDGERLVDCKKMQFGVRHVELIREDFAGEKEAFCFRLNNRPVTLCGFNLVPPSMLYSHGEKEWAHLAECLKDTNSSVARIWGGGVYPPDEFFELCDKYGVFVWQDFMLACHSYPQTEELQRQIREEATSVVKRIRNHCSILLYCGGNEIDWSYYCVGLNPNEDIYSRRIFPEVLFSHDPHRIYLPSTQYMSQGYFEKYGGKFLIDLEEIVDNRKELSEEHYWWHRDDYKAYGKMRHNFVAEIGFSGCPSVQTVKKMTDNYLPFNKENPALKPFEFSTEGDFLYAMSYMFDGVEDSLEEKVLATQLYQGEAYKYVLENTRIREKLNGVILWTLNERCPSFGSGIIDYYNDKKESYRYVKNSLQPVQIILQEKDGVVEGYAVNDTLAEVETPYFVEDIQGKRIQEGKVKIHSGEIVYLFTLSDCKQPLFAHLEKEGVTNGYFPSSVRCFKSYKEFYAKLEKFIK